MVNAIPPTFTYLVACAAQGVTAEAFRPFREAGAALALPPTEAPVTAPDSEGRSYPAKRGFRAALPGLRFKSGMRFDLSNEMVGDDATWRVRFFFGPSKDIREVELDGSVIADLRRDLAGAAFSDFRAKLVKAEAELGRSSPKALQDRWTHRAKGLSPFDVADLLGELAEEVLTLLEETMADRDAAGPFVRQVASTAPGRWRRSGPAQGRALRSASLGRLHCRRLVQHPELARPAQGCGLGFDPDQDQRDAWRPAAATHQMVELALVVGWA